MYEVRVYFERWITDLVTHSRREASDRMYWLSKTSDPSRRVVADVFYNDEWAGLEFNRFTGELR